MCFRFQSQKSYLTTDVRKIPIYYKKLKLYCTDKWIFCIETCIFSIVNKPTSLSVTSTWFMLSLERALVNGHLCQSLPSTRRTSSSFRRHSQHELESPRLTCKKQLLDVVTHFSRRNSENLGLNFIFRRWNQISWSSEFYVYHYTCPWNHSRQIVAILKKETFYFSFLKTG